MIWFVGIFWMILFFALAAIMAILAIFAASEGSKSWIALAVATLVFGYLGIFAGTHFRVPVNQRSLLVDTINQRVIGVREQGVQKRPLIGVRVMNWPANKAYQLVLDLQPGTTSATSKDKIALWTDSTVYVDLSQMDLVAAFKAVNGDWGKFKKEYLIPQLMNENRRTSKDFTVLQHSMEKDQWSQKFDQNVADFLSDPARGYGIKIVEGRTIMSFDFVNEADAKAFDKSNTAAFLQTQRANEKAALQIEADMVGIRASMIVSTTTGTIESLKAVGTMLEESPEWERPYLMQYLGTLTNMEYLRLVGQQEPDIIFPPGNQPQAVFDTANK